MKDNQQINEGVREIVMGLLSMAAFAYEANYIHRMLSDRPETTEEKIKALQIVSSEDINPEFDKSIEELQKHYSSQKPVLVKITGPPNVGKPQIVPNNISDELIDLIKKYETFSPTPYWDIKQTSIGYGTKALPTDKVITEKEAYKRLIQTIKLHRKKVLQASKEWGYNWNDNQINALTSFRYNIGTIGQLTNNGTRSNSEIVENMVKYVKADNKVLEGLVARRNAERDMFLSK
jgi:GH24 family phage-related lysozyme (muramidase)